MNNAERRATRRRAADAATRVRRAVADVLREADEATTDEQRWLAGYEAQTLLGELLAGALDLAGALHEHEDFDVDELAAAARAVHGSAASASRRSSSGSRGARPRRPPRSARGRTRCAGA